MRCSSRCSSRSAARSAATSRRRARPRAAIGLRHDTGRRLRLDTPARRPRPARRGPDSAEGRASRQPGLTVDVFNAGSQKGQAKEVAAKLEAAGYRIGEVDERQVDYPGATIIHPKAMEREARVLARRTGITTLQVAPGSQTHITIVVA